MTTKHSAERRVALASSIWSASRNRSTLISFLIRRVSVADLTKAFDQSSQLYAAFGSKLGRIPRVLKRYRMTDAIPLGALFCASRSPDREVLIDALRSGKTLPPT